MIDVVDDVATAIRLEGSAQITAGRKVELGDSTGIWIGGTYVGNVRLPLKLEVVS